MTSEPCNLCQGTSFQQISDTDRHGQPLATVACEQCGLVRHAVLPTEADLTAFYSTEYRKAYNKERTPGARRIMRAWNNGERICRQISSHLRPGGRVLEVGAGIGCTVKVFENAGFQAEGIDPGGEFLQFAIKKLNARVQVQTLDDLKGQNIFDTILLVHVIEHLRTPLEALRKIGNLLKPGGMFYVECPNLQAPFARRSQLFHFAHIHNFVPSTLQMMAEAAGFELVQRFSDERDSNLQMLFRNTRQSRHKIDAGNYQRTITELRRSDLIPYFSRPRYMLDRIRKVTGYAKEHLQARAFVERLIADCRNGALSESSLGIQSKAG
jgi:2-polyprenyl-3-methyl-5-hydroxy-6-metoxy-1,4-benzoquinol methylase